MSVPTIVLSLVLATALLLAALLLRMRDYRGPEPDEVVRALRRLQGRAECTSAAPALAEDGDLGRLREDFLAVWNAGRMMAATSADPDFVFHLFRAYGEFHYHYAAVRLERSFGLAGLRGHADALAKSAASMAQSTEPLLTTTGVS